MFARAAARSEAPAPRSLLRPALAWAVVHGLLVLWFFRKPLGLALADAPPRLHLPLLATFAVQAIFLGLVGFLATLPLLAFRRAYAWAAPLLIGLLSTFLYVDSLVFGSIGFHINGLVLTVAMQPGGGLAETGLPKDEIALLAAVVAGLLALGTWAGSLVLRRFASSRRVWTWVLAIVGLWTVERIGSAGLVFVGGIPLETASTTLPLQPPVRMNKQFTSITGRQPAVVAELSLGGVPRIGTPPGKLDPADVTLDRKRDVVFLLIESLPADFLDPEVMPNLWRRSREGTVFPRHYSAAAATDYSVCSILFGLDAHRRDALLGLGRTPFLFPALKRNGYAIHLLAASSVAWMDLKETVFRDVADRLQTDFDGAFDERDADMLARADRILDGASPDEPLFLFLFFAGTHFPYPYPERSAIFEPAWDGKGTLSASRVSPELLRNRAKNAAHEVDSKLEAFLTSYEQKRGGKPVLLVTGDHGEEFNENGRVGHATDVTVGQIHVPMVLFDESVPAGTADRPTGHVDILPTILSLLGDEHDPALYSDGLAMQSAPEDRYVLSVAGWLRKFALVSKDMKVTLHETMEGVRVTDPEDRPLPDAEARFAADSPRLLRRLRGQGHDREELGSSVAR
ncbi:sulfatase-like hydrolase/transferase [Vulgatibacter incomptus]|uniref:Putative hydrolase n=1 Tax=Vulgatibacter incomptus TaxID=1391653 RepID=A0A0K1PCV7_9BACT|nr:sulfatase-like hydrolase/transferase [Vulgatibacter incomptus]AKU91231.1 putative hydrolase [Vulgatibacter incomptus]